MITLDFNTSKAAEAIRNSLDQLRDMTPIYGDIREYMIEVTRRRFIEGTAPDGSKWAPKKKSTLDRYKRLGYGTLARLQPLVGPGKRLSREILGEGGLKLFSDANASGVVIGSSLIYSRVMQDGAAKGAFGSDRHGRPLPWGRIPARQWLGVSKKDEQVIVDIVEEALGKHLSSE